MIFILRNAYFYTEWNNTVFLHFKYLTGFPLCPFCGNTVKIISLSCFFFFFFTLPLSSHCTYVWFHHVDRSCWAKVFTYNLILLTELNNKEITSNCTYWQQIENVLQVMLHTVLETTWLNSNLKPHLHFHCL